MSDWDVTLYRSGDLDKLYAYRRRKAVKEQGKYWCSACDKIKDPHEFYARKQVSVKHTDHYSDCKECSNERAKYAKRTARWSDGDPRWELFRLKDEAREQGKKLCMACLRPKDPDEFRRVKGHEDEPDPLKYRYSYCTRCHNARQRRSKLQRKRAA